MHNTFKRLLIFLTAVFLLNTAGVFAQEKQNSFFDLNNIAGNIINASSENTKEKSPFLEANKKFKQGNVSVAWEDYAKLIPGVKNDFALLNLARGLYEIGFFDLAQSAISQINHKENITSQLDELQTAYGANYTLNKEDEIYLARALSSIFYDNCAEETAFELNKKKELLEKSDYANFVMAQAQIQLKQYSQALNFINKALDKNPKNTSYLYCKSKILILSENYKSALKFIQNLEDKNAFGLVFKNDFLVQKEYILENLAKNDADKKYHSAKISYIKGDYYKSIKKCDEILSTDKESYKTLALLGANNLKIGNLTQAAQNFEQAYKKNPKYAPALEGMGDVQFINFNYALALKYYQKAFEQGKSPLLTNKIMLAVEFTHDSKIGEKFKKIAAATDEKPFFEYYEIATTLGRYDTKDRLLRQEYIIKSIVTYPLYQNSWAEFVKIEIARANYPFAKNILFAISLSEKMDYNYYYNYALLNLGFNKPKEALENLKIALSLNEDYLPAKELQAEILADINESI